MRRYQPRRYVLTFQPMNARHLILLLFLVLASPMHAQDTLRLSAPEFIRMAIERSSVRQLSQSRVDLAENRLKDANLNRYVPRFELQTAHGLVPGVMSTSDATTRPSDQAYLDPSLRNDWSSWGFFTRAEVTALQPLYTWGALTNAISAAKEGATIAGYDHQTEVAKLETQLYELYQSRLLSLELKRLVDEAAKDFKKAEERLNELMEEGEQDISEADVFKFQLFRHEFDARAFEVEQNLRFVESAWNVALSNANVSMVYEPSDVYIDPIDTSLSAYPVYEQWALQGRPDLRKADAAARAAHHGLQAARAQQYPSLFMAFTAAYAKTPNRPRQANPFIINNTNYESIRYGIGFRQNLNFGLIRNQIDRSRIQVEQARDAKSALESGLRLELLDSYKTASIALSRYNQTTKMLQVSNEWLRLEQINYDYEIGEIKDLVEAVQKNLELKALQKQRVYEWNVQLGRLMSRSGRSVTDLFQN